MGEQFHMLVLLVAEGHCRVGAEGARTLLIGPHMGPYVAEIMVQWHLETDESYCSGLKIYINSYKSL